MDLKGQHIPKATMTSYLKDKLGKTKISTQFVEGILFLSKQYIARIANKANEVCTNQNKKTISLDHLYQSIEHFNLKEQMEELKKVETQVKQEVEHKHQVKLKIQRSYEEMIKQGQGDLQKDINLPALKQGGHSNLFKKDSSDSEDYEDQCLEKFEKKGSQIDEQ